MTPWSADSGVPISTRAALAIVGGVCCLATVLAALALLASFAYHAHLGAALVPFAVFVSLLLVDAALLEYWRRERTSTAN